MPPQKPLPSRYGLMVANIGAILISIPLTFGILVMGAFIFDIGHPTALSYGVLYFAYGTVLFAIVSTIMSQRKHSWRWAMAPFVYMGVLLLLLILGASI